MKVFLGLLWVGLIALFISDAMTGWEGFKNDPALASMILSTTTLTTILYLLFRLKKYSKRRRDEEIVAAIDKRAYQQLKERLYSSFKVALPESRMEFLLNKEDLIVTYQPQIDSEMIDKAISYNRAIMVKRATQGYKGEDPAQLANQTMGVVHFDEAKAVYWEGWATAKEAGFAVRESFSDYLA